MATKPRSAAEHYDRFRPAYPRDLSTPARLGIAVRAGTAARPGRGTGQSTFALADRSAETWAVENGGGPAGSRQSGSRMRLELPAAGVVPGVWMVGVASDCVDIYPYDL